MERFIGQENAKVRDTSEPSDPYNLRRFVTKQCEYHQQAVRELRAGHKASCWSWWILPTAPFIRNGIRVGSPTNRIYELETDAEGLAYLNFKDYPLRTNFLEVVRICNDQLESGVEPRRLLGIDVPRFEASVKYFEHLAGEADDAELGEVCRRALELLGSGTGVADSKGARSSGGGAGAVKRALSPAGNAATSKSKMTAAGGAAAAKPTVEALAPDDDDAAEGK